VAAQSGNRPCVESTIEVPVAGAAQSVSGPLAAAGLERGDTSQRGECGFAADAAAVGPADQELGGDDGADAGSASSAGPAACCGPAACAADDQIPLRKTEALAREGRVWLRSPCVMSLTGNVRPAFLGRLGC